MTRSRDLVGLTELAALRFRAAQTDMAVLLSREAALRRNLTQLVESKSEQAKAPRKPDEAALIAGADIRWHRWVDQRRAKINAELAQVLAQKEYCRAKLAQAFGRDQAAQTLAADLSKKEAIIRQRRKDYES